MTSPFESDQDKTIPLSHARVKRRDNSRIETFPTELEDILTRAITKEVSEKIERLEKLRQNTETDLEEVLTRAVNTELVDKSIDCITAQFQAIPNNESDDIALKVTTDIRFINIGLASAQLKSEHYYTHTCSTIAGKFNISITQVINLIKKLELQGNSSYHKKFQIGAKSFVHKYSEEALVKIKKEIDS